MKVGIIEVRKRACIMSKHKNSNKINKIYCFPGNAGTSNIAENIKINPEDFENIKNFIIENKIDLVIVGPEKP